MRTYRFVLILVLLAFASSINLAVADPADEVSAAVDRWAAVIQCQ